MTATGLPFLVMVTRSCVPATSSITWLKCALTAASDWVVMTRIVVQFVSCGQAARPWLRQNLRAPPAQFGGGDDGTGERAERRHADRFVPLTDDPGRCPQPPARTDQASDRHPETTEPLQSSGRRAMRRRRAGQLVEHRLPAAGWSSSGR